MPHEKHLPNEHPPFCDGDELLRAEGALRVDVYDAALRASLIQRPLRSDAQCVAELSLPGTKLSKNFCHRSSFDPATKKHI